MLASQGGLSSWAGPLQQVPDSGVASEVALDGQADIGLLAHVVSVHFLTTHSEVELPS